jgi:AraC-like DNA-binding protein
MKMTIREKESNDFVAGEYLVCMRDFALNKHISVKDLLKGSNKDVNFLLDPPKKIDECSMNIISTNLFRGFTDPITAAIEFGKSMSMSSHGALGLAIQGCKQLKDVARLTQQYFKTRSSARIIQFTSDQQFTFLRLDDAEPLNESSNTLDTRFYTGLSTLINIDQLIKELLSHHDISQTCVLHLQRPQPKHYTATKLPSNLIIEFNKPFFQLGIPSTWMQLPLRQGDSELARMATHECESTLKQLSPTGLIQQIYKALDDGPTNNLNLQNMAKQLNMSVSTLQRRLKELNTTYQHIKSQVRIKQAKALLRHSKQSLESIADAMGYSDASNFSKSFKSQTGCTPNVYRSQF